MKQYNLIFKKPNGDLFNYLVFDIDNILKYVEYFLRKGYLLASIEEVN